MEKIFMAEEHYFRKAVAKAGISFPITKADAVAKAGDLAVRVDFDQYITLASMIENMCPDYYENAAAFYCGYWAAAMIDLKKKVGY